MKWIDSGVLAFLALATPVGAQEPNWDDLAARPFPQWFSDAKLGIFIHWGLYSVPSWSGPEQYAEWFLRGLQSGDEPRLDYLKRVYGEEFKYEDLAPLFKAELFEPTEWAELFRDSGAQYVVLTSKHHDGFALWPSAHATQSRGFAWNAMDVGPKRDLVGELSSAVRAAGLRMGLYYSLPEWNHPIYQWANKNPANDVDRYVAEHMIPQFKDVMSRYKPAVIFSDGDWDHPASTWKSGELMDWLYTESGCPEDLAVNDRWGGGSKGGFRTPEYSAGAPPGDRPWAECRGLGRSFGLNRNEKLDAYLRPDQLIHFFARSVSHGGGMLLNVGPGADGQIPLLQQERLRQLGAWISVNHEAIYGAKPAARLGEWVTSDVERVDANIDFDWVRNSPLDRIEPDHFTATWTGFIEASADGPYIFELEADDHATLWIDGQKIATSKEPGICVMAADQRTSIRVEFKETTHQAVARLYWAHEDGLKHIVPTDALYTTADGAAHGLNAEYTSLWQTVAYTKNHGNHYAIVMDWPGDELRLQTPRPGEGSKIQMLGLERDLAWTWSDKTLSIDTSSIGINDLPCHHTWTFKIKTADSFHRVGVHGFRSSGGKFQFDLFPQPVFTYLGDQVDLPEGYLQSVAEGNRIYAKPRSGYIHPLNGLDGEELTLDWSHDHPHHRGIYWAWPEVKFGNEVGDLHALQRVYSRPKGQPMTLSRGKNVGVRATNIWMWEDQTPIVKVMAEVTLVLGNDLYGQTVDLDLKLTALADGVSLARRGTDKYGGLNVRLAPVQNLQFSQSGTGLITTSPVAPTRNANGGNPNQTLPAWSAATGIWQGGKQLTTLAILEHPANPNYPADVITYPELPWFQPTFPKAGTRYELKKGEILRLRYRFLVMPGPTDSVMLNDAWRAYKSDG